MRTGQGGLGSLRTLRGAQHPHHKHLCFANGAKQPKLFFQGSREALEEPQLQYPEPPSPAFQTKPNLFLSLCATTCSFYSTLQLKPHHGKSVVAFCFRAGACQVFLGNSKTSFLKFFFLFFWWGGEGGGHAVEKIPFPSNSLSISGTLQPVPWPCPGISQRLLTWLPLWCLVQGDSCKQSSEIIGEGWGEPLCARH